ncbi:hypothetical protein GHT09_007914 [Marmota monax]|uniref:Uncharacterized protein n=1 Tax=Marmota monax TaxID=9995 RepID=A0A834QQ89_MARMO|nr:hypothetical protein GHT09_007914 [Marmota monax]
MLALPLGEVQSSSCLTGDHPPHGWSVQRRLSLPQVEAPCFHVLLPQTPGGSVKEGAHEHTPQQKPVSGPAPRSRLRTSALLSLLLQKPSRTSEPGSVSRACSCPSGLGVAHGGSGAGSLWSSFL